MAFQISVFLENKIGHFQKVTKVLREHQINILTMTLTNTANGWGILNLLVNDPDAACLMLNENGITAALREVIALEMEDKPGGLDDLLIKIAGAGINFDNALGRVTEVNKKAMLLLDVPDLLSARRLMRAYDIRELSDKMVYGKD